MQSKMSSSLRVACLLTFVGGFLEIYSYILKGGVFATTITGDIIKFVYNISQRNYYESINYIIPIIGFSIGVYIAIAVERKYEKTNRYWREGVILVEIIIILLVYILKAEQFNFLTNSMIAAISAIQLQSFIKVRDTTYMSTMCTGNTRKLVEAIAKKDKEGIEIFFYIVMSFALGILIGDFMIVKFNTASILLLIIPLLAVFFTIRHKKDKQA